MCSDSYVTDVPYTSAFAPALAPTELTVSCALAGVLPPRVERPFRYLDLGCGHATSLTVFAAAMPYAEFWGVDFMPEHIAAAEAVRKQAGLQNLHLVCADLRTLAADALPEMDFVVLHGLYSWVSESVRAAALGLAAQSLREGGLVYVSYNAWPGWCALAPLRDMMLTFTKGMPGTTLERAQKAVEYLHFMRKFGAAYFEMSPAAAELVDQLVTRDLHYVVHEYFNPHWAFFRFAEVKAHGESFGLHYVGSSPAYLNRDDLVLSVPMQALVERWRGEAPRELLVDAATHETFRQDLFVKGTPVTVEPREWLGQGLIGTHLVRPRLGAAVRLKNRELTWSTPLYEALFEHVSRRSLDPSEWDEALGSLASTSEQEAALTRALLGGQVTRFVGATHAAAQLEAKPTGRFRLALWLNCWFLETQLWTRPAVLVVAQPLGTAFVLPFRVALVLAGLTEVGAGAFVGWATQQLYAHSVKLQRPGGGTAVEGEALQELLAETLSEFWAHRLPKLLELRVLTPC